MTETDIKKIAGKYLGKTQSGEFMMPYEAPDKHDPSLLVPIPREIGRTSGNITSRMAGYDVWHAYEFSFLNQNNQPRTGILKFLIPQNSKNMIESKSFKLYLNSFDFERFDNDGAFVTNIIEDEVSKVIGGSCMVHFHPSRLTLNFRTTLSLDAAVMYTPNAPTNNLQYNVDRLIIDNIEFNENPGYLQTLLWNENNTNKYFHTANLRSACEITNQKDTGHCFIVMNGESVFRSEELARYIFSLRNAQHFHENVTEIIFDTLYKFYEPRDLLVANFYNRRGGLDIHPVRSTSLDFIGDVLPSYSDVKELYTATNQV